MFTGAIYPLYWKSNLKQLVSRFWQHQALLQVSSTSIKAISFAVAASTTSGRCSNVVGSVTPFLGSGSPNNSVAQGLASLHFWSKRRISHLSWDGSSGRNHRLPNCQKRMERSESRIHGQRLQCYQWTQWDSNKIVTYHRKIFLLKPFRRLINKSLHIEQHKQTTIIIVFLLWHLATKGKGCKNITGNPDF